MNRKNMNLTLDQKLLVFFAGNANENDLVSHQEYHPFTKEEHAPMARGAIIYPSVIYNREELRIRYARAMLKKFKEFESL